MGAGRLDAARLILLPAALPGYLAGGQAGLGVLLALADGRGDHRRRPRSWASAWAPTSSRAATSTRSPGVIAAIFLILLVGVGIELLVFRPLERRVLRTRGLALA